MYQPKIARDSELDYDSDLVWTLEGVPFTGIAFEESPDLGRSEVCFREGIQEGPARDWSPSGVLKGESHYVQGVLHGTSKEFDEGGRLVSEAHYEYGICVIVRRFSSDGAVVPIEEIDPIGDAARLLDRLRSEHAWGL